MRANNALVSFSTMSLARSFASSMNSKDCQEVQPCTSVTKNGANEHDPFFLISFENSSPTLDSPILEEVLPKNSSTGQRARRGGRLPKQIITNNGGRWLIMVRHALSILIKRGDARTPYFNTHRTIGMVKQPFLSKLPKKKIVEDTRKKETVVSSSFPDEFLEADTPLQSVSAATEPRVVLCCSPADSTGSSSSDKMGWNHLTMTLDS